MPRRKPGFGLNDKGYLARWPFYFSDREFSRRAAYNPSFLSPRSIRIATICMSITLPDLLSRRATVLHRTRRSYFEKRIVEFSGQQYVLYRFPSRAVARRFAGILAQASEAGAALQRIVARPARGLAGLRHGRWLALSFVAGAQINGQSTEPVIFSSLGKTLAILHRQAAVRRVALLYAPPLDVGFDVARQHAHPGKRWLAESSKRLADLRAFRLVHSDLYAKNIIVTPENESVLIDYELFAYDLPGIELAMLLLRHICRLEAKRQVLLEAYLAHCDTETRELWETHWQDFLVAAALRISAHRDRRRNILQSRHDRLNHLLRLPMPARLRASLMAILAGYGTQIEFSRKAREHHQELAEKMVVLITGGAFPDANALITACFQKRRRSREK